MWLRGLCFGTALAAVALLVASGPGVRAGLWPYQTGFLLMRIAVFVAAAAVLLGVAGLFIPRARSAMLVAGLLLGLATALVPLDLLRRARSFPPINDVSTGGDIQPLILEEPAEAAFAKARAAARDMGWEIVSADPAAGRIEAVATTFWFGFKDDVTVRVTPQGGASRIDVRSKSRVGRGDAGANARRIREYLERLRT